ALTPKDMEAALLSRLPWELQIKVDELAPGSLALPTNRRAKLHYRPHDPHPRLSVRVQELYGLALHPTINAGLTPVLMELLSPAQRPIQTTLDLPGFWQGSWEDIRKQMRGRYPKHLWPDDPANAQPTMRAKPRK
ncbi:MAG: ATP-dependent helicase C-terminal domain-containing protein, partial [Pseudomonadota bacterium]